MSVYVCVCLISVYLCVSVDECMHGVSVSVNIYLYVSMIVDALSTCEYVYMAV